MQELNPLTPELATQTVNFIEGKFSVSEAADILLDILDKKINFHVLNRLSLTERNHDDACQEDSGRIHELRKSKEELIKLLADARGTGCKFEIKSTIEIVAIED